jgi:hypothetical protein
MPSFKQSLQGHDLGHLRIVAEMWGFELEASELRVAMEELTSELQDENRIAEVIDTLPDEARAALDELLRNGGRLPWPRFTRLFGEVREMGPGRRDREQPFRRPVSPAETLWYRGLVGRAFFDSATGPEEYAYIPEDIVPALPTPQGDRVDPIGRPASKIEFSHRVPAHDRILDDACTLLAALRVGKSPDTIHDFASHPDASASPTALFPLSSNFVISLLDAASLLDSQNMPQPEPTRAFLESTRGEALALLGRAWLKSATLNELHLIPDLQPEGEWENDPLQARRTVLSFLSQIPQGTWWNLEGFVSGMRESHPDFQRPAGDYDSWFIRERHTGEYLRGFEHWDHVDGRLIRYLITGPMHWLGFLDLGSPDVGATITAFRSSKWSAALLKSNTPEGLPEEESRAIVTSDARVSVPRLAPRAARYQMARFSIWEKVAHDTYDFRITPTSLERAREQGLRSSHLEALLQRYAEAVPPSLIIALERWEDRGREVHLARSLVLRVKSPEILKELRASRAARFLADPLGPTAIIVKPGAWEKVLNILAEMGYLGEADLED